MAHRLTCSDAYALSPKPFGLGKDARVIALRAQLPLVAEDASKSWVHLCYVESYEGHPAGPFAFTPDVFAQIVRNFERQVNPVPVLYGHPMGDDGQPVPAAGWIHELEVRGSDLYGLVEWTPRAAKMIRDGEYRYCSVVVGFGAIDERDGKDIGAKLFELGLTNTPFVDGQEPIRLSRRALSAGGKMDPQKIIDGLSKLLGVDAAAEKDKVLAMLGAVFDYLGAMNGEAEPKEEPAEMAAMPEDDKEQVAKMARKLARAIKLELPGDVSQTGDNSEQVAAGTALLDKLTTATGLDAAALMAGVEANLDAIAAMLSGDAASGNPSDAGAAEDAQTMQLSAVSARLAASDKRIVELSAKLSAYERREVEAKAKEAERAIDNAIKCGHILEDAKPFFAKLAEKMPEEFDKQLEAAAARPVVPTGTVIKQAPGGAESVALSTRDAAERSFVDGLRQLKHSDKQIAVMLDAYRSKRAKRAKTA